MKYTFLLLLFCFFSCKESPVPTYGPYARLFSKPVSPSLINLQEKFSDLKKPELKILFQLDSSWSFSPGDSTEILHEAVRQRNGDQVDLPHRVQLPDRALWYSRRLTLTHPGVFAIRADDGAQLFINGKNVRRTEEIFFPVPTTGEIEVSIRVLNNAMAGGLSKVAFSTNTDFLEYKKEKALRDRLSAIIEKTLLVNDRLNPALIDRAMLALESRTEASIADCEKYFERRPYFTGPWLIRKDPTTMIVMMEQDGQYPVELTYGEEKDRMTKRIELNGTVLKFELKDLGQDVHYFYQIRSAKTISQVYSFTNRTDIHAFSFNIWADSQSGWEFFQQNVQNTSSVNDAFGIGVGDLVANGSDQGEWKKFFKILGPSSAERPFYLIAGNHDYDGYYDDLDPQNYRKYTDYNPNRYFSWYFGNTAFIALDPNGNFPIGIDTVQYEWFKEQLNKESWQNATWRFVMLHQTLYSQGWKDYEGDEVLRRAIEPHIESAGIDFVISGHTHDYERLLKKYGEHEVMFLIVGGAGGSLEPPESSDQPKMDTVIKQHHMGRFWIDGNNLRFEARNLKNETMDFFNRTKK